MTTPTWWRVVWVTTCWSSSSLTCRTSWRCVRRASQGECITTAVHYHHICHYHPIRWEGFFFFFQCWDGRWTWTHYSNLSFTFCVIHFQTIQNVIFSLCEVLLVITFSSDIWRRREWCFHASSLCLILLCLRSWVKPLIPTPSRLTSSPSLTTPRLCASMTKTMTASLLSHHLREKLYRWQYALDWKLFYWGVRCINVL